MVAYKRLTIKECEQVARKMESIRRDNEINGRVKVVSKKIEDVLWNEVPEDVKEMYNKYPQYVNVCEFGISSYLFFRMDENVTCCHYYNTPVFKMSKILNNAYNNFNKYNNISSYNHPLVTYLNTHYPELYNECREIVLEAYKIHQWSKKVLCILKNISTLNKLKNEFPEAYNTYVSIYICDDITNNTYSNKVVNMCDNKRQRAHTLAMHIENVRAEFNHSNQIM